MRHRFNYISLIALLIGSLIYLFFREGNLVLFNWVDFVGLDYYLDQARKVTLEYKTYLPSWVYYSLPNSLWLFSLMTILAVIWKKGWKLYAYLLIVIGLAVSLEIGQSMGVVAGNFDPIDLLLILIAIFLALSMIVPKVKLRKWSDYEPKY